MTTNELAMTDLPATPKWILAMAGDKNLSVNKDNPDPEAITILKGTRNDRLFEEGCRQRHYGASFEEILESLKKRNEDCCDPPLEADEVEDIAQRAASYEAGPTNSMTPSSGKQEGETSGIYSSLLDLLTADIPEAEEIVFGIGRGEVGMLVSITNVGKTTLMLNLALSLAAGQPYLPLAPEVAKPRRVLYCDFEARASKQKPYLEKMLQKMGNDESAAMNVIPFNTPVLNDEQMNLSNPAHMKYVTDYAKAHGADLIIIDTVGAAFDLSDENSNAEVTRRALKPLIRMAREANTAVLFCHHSGKPTESHTNEKAYAARGASAWGGLSRAVFLLTRDKKKGQDYVVLECVKIKGQSFDPQLLQLNRDVAWFEVCNERPEIEKDLTAQEIAEFVNGKGEAKRQEILEHFKGRSSKETMDRRLEDAVKYGFIDKPQKGVFRSRGNAPTENDAEVK